MRDGDRRETSGLGILHSKMSETANADDGGAFARLRYPVNFQSCPKAFGVTH